MVGNRYLPSNFYQEQPTEAFPPLPIIPYHARTAERSGVSTVGNPVNPSSNWRPSFPTIVLKRGAVVILAVAMAHVVAYVTTRGDLSSPWLALQDAWSSPLLSFSWVLRDSRSQNGHNTIHPPHELLTEISSIHSLTSPTPADRDTKGANVFGRIPHPSCGPDIIFGATSVPVICASSSWEFIGTTGQLGILFPRPSRLNTVTIQVQHEAVLPKCAPRDLVLWGLVGRQRDLAALRRRHHSVDHVFAALPGAVAFPVHEGHQILVPLAVFRFNAYSENLTQTFPVGSLWDMGYNMAGLHEEDAMMGFGVAILQILTNWGSSLTCIHRLYFHGQGL